MKKGNGFTLIELLATILILAIIIVITIPKVNSILNDSKKSLLKIDAGEMIDLINKKIVMDRHFDITTIDVSNIESILGIGVDNYEQVLAQRYGDEIYIYIAGKNKWDGLYAYGTVDDIQITTEPVLVYYTTPTTYEYTSTTTELIMNADNYLTAGCDDCYGTINLGFDFNFGGQLYSKIYVGSNGKIVFSEKVTDYQYYRGNVDFNKGAPGFPVIAVYWTDMLIDKPNFSNSGIFYDFGTENGKNYVLIEYRNIINYGNAGTTVDHPGSFEVKLYEDGIIKAYYADVEFASYTYNNGADATLGVKVGDLNYAQYSYEEALIANNTAVMYDLKFGVKTPSDPVLADASCFTFNSSTKTITAYNDNNPICPKSLIIPSSISGVPVQIIGTSAFVRKGLVNVVIPSGVTTIGNYAFMENQLTKVTIPNSVTTIGNKAFAKNFLTEANIPSSVTVIDYEAFNDNLFPDETAYIYVRNPDGSINNTKVVSYAGKRRENIVIPSNITTIGDSAFSGLKITNVTIPSSVTSIEMYAFYDNLLSEITIPQSITTITEGAFSFNKIKNLVLPDNIQTIEMYGFEENEMESVTFGTGIKTIGEWSFEVNSLTSVVIPNSVTDLQAGAFSWNQIANVTLGTGITVINPYTFEQNNITSVVIPSTITSIGNNAFNKNKIASLTIPTSVVSIEKQAFNDNLLPDDQAFIYARNADGSINNTIVVSYGGSKKDNVIIPSTVTTIGPSSFYYTKLISVTIPNSVTTIGTSAFSQNELTNVSIGSGVTLIDQWAFSNNKFTSVTIPGNVQTLGNFCFANGELTSLTLINGIKTINQSAFQNNILTSVLIPNSVTTVTNYSFSTNRIRQGNAQIDNASGSVTVGSLAFYKNEISGLTTITPTYLR